jgi:hypothetical protein
MPFQPVISGDAGSIFRPAEYNMSSNIAIAPHSANHPVRKKTISSAKKKPRSRQAAIPAAINAKPQVRIIANSPRRRIPVIRITKSPIPHNVFILPIFLLMQKRNQAGTERDFK